jgi:hypothetical protein
MQLPAPMPDTRIPRSRPSGNGKRSRPAALADPDRSANDLDALLPAVIADLAGERGLEQSWVPPLNGTERACSLAASAWRFDAPPASYRRSHPERARCESNKELSIKRKADPEAAPVANT